MDQKSETLSIFEFPLLLDELFAIFVYSPILLIK